MTQKKICKMCGSDNTQTYFNLQKNDWVTECEDCDYWERAKDPIQKENGE